MLPAQWIVVFTSVFNYIFFSGSCPNTWSQANLVTGFKKGDKRNVRNCRGIGVINCMAKLYDMVLSSRLNHTGSRQVLRRRAAWNILFLCACCVTQLEEGSCLYL